MVINKPSSDLIQQLQETSKNIENFQKKYSKEKSIPAEDIQKILNVIEKCNKSISEKNFKELNPELGTSVVDQLTHVIRELPQELENNPALQIQVNQMKVTQVQATLFGSFITQLKALAHNLDDWKIGRKVGSSDKSKSSGN